MNFLSTPDDFIHYFSVCKPRLIAIDPSLYGTIIKALTEIQSLFNVSIVSLGGLCPGLACVSGLLVSSQSWLMVNSIH